MQRKHSGLDDHPVEDHLTVPVGTVAKDRRDDRGGGPGESCGSGTEKGPAGGGGVPDLPGEGARAVDSPVFVDSSGGRRRLLRKFGWLLGVVCLGYAVLLGISLVGGSAGAPDVLIPGPDKKAPEKVEDDPSRRESDAPAVPGTVHGSSADAAGSPSPGSASASAKSGAEAGASARGSSSKAEPEPKSSRGGEKKTGGGSGGKQSGRPATTKPPAKPGDTDRPDPPDPDPTGTETSGAADGGDVAEAVG